MIELTLLRRSCHQRRIFRAQASIEYLMVLLILLVILQILGASMQIFHSNYQSIHLLSSEQQTLAAQAFVLSVRVCDIGVILPASFNSRLQTQNGYLLSPSNSSLIMHVLGPPPNQKIPS